MLLAWYIILRALHHSRIFDDPCSRREKRRETWKGLPTFSVILAKIFIDFQIGMLSAKKKKRKKEKKKKSGHSSSPGKKKLSRLITHEHRIFTDKETHVLIWSITNDHA